MALRPSVQQAESLSVKNRKVFRILLSSAMPATISMGSTALYNVADVFFVGRGPGAVGIAAVSAAFPAQLVSIGVGLTVGVGAASIGSRSLGSGNYAGYAEAVGNGIILSGILSCLVASITLVTLPELLSALGVSGPMRGDTHRYVMAIMIGLPAFVGTISGAELIRASGDVGAAMKITLMGALLNTALDPLLILVFRLGVLGAGIATSAAQLVSWGMVLRYFLTDRGPKGIRFGDMKLRRSLCMRILMIGLPTLVRQVGQAMALTTVNRALLRLGSSYAIAAFGIVSRLHFLLLLPLVGISQALQPILSYSQGLGDQARMRSALVGALLAAFALSVAIVLTLFPLQETLLALFSDDNELLLRGQEAMRPVLLSSPLLALYIVAVAGLQAIGRPVFSLLFGLARSFLVFIPLVLVLSRSIGERGVWLAFPITEAFVAPCAVACMCVLITRRRDID